MHNLILTNVVFFSTIAAEFIFNSYLNTTTHLSLDKYLSLFLILALFSFIKPKKIRIIAMNLILGLSFFQMMHLQFYGVPAYPTAIYLLFAELGEVTGTLSQELSLFTIPLLIIIPTLGVNLLTEKKSFKLKSFPFIHWIFIFYVIFNPLRTFFTGNTWGRQPSTQEFMGMNIYLSTSYFLGRLLPVKLTQNDQSIYKAPNISFKKSLPKDTNIIFIIGESLSANHISLLNYKRKTTPFLDSIKNRKNFIYRRGISAGVSTDISIAMIMNNTYGLGANQEIIKGEKCLFKFAKSNNIKTHFYSTQSAQQLRYITNSICPKYIDDYKDLEVIQPDLENSNKADDLELVKLIPKDLKTTNNLIVLHQRGSHSPYNLRYPKDQTIFPLTGSYNEDRVNHYDNSVIQFDLFMKKIIQKVEKYSTPTIIIYMSDHGEGLGEEGVWGHAALLRPSFEIPVLLYFHKAVDLHNKSQKLSKNPVHLNITLLISSLLGFEPSMKFYETPSDYTILANDIDGFAGYLETHFKNGKLINFKRRDI